MSHARKPKPQPDMPDLKIAETGDDSPFDIFFANGLAIEIWPQGPPEGHPIFRGDKVVPATKGNAVAVIRRCRTEKPGLPPRG
jgi:hypothetical protein